MNYDEAKAIAFAHVTPRVGEVLSEYAYPLRVVSIENGRVFYSNQSKPNELFSVDASQWATRGRHHVNPTRPWPRR